MKNKKTIMDKKLNNLIEFKEFSIKFKVENKPGKIIENLNNIQAYEGFFTDTKIGNKIRKGTGFKNKDEKFDDAEQEIFKHPIKNKIYKKLKSEDPEKANKYVEFFVKNPVGHPKWENGEWIDSARYKYNII